MRKSSILLAIIGLSFTACKKENSADNRLLNNKQELETIATKYNLEKANGLQAENPKTIKFNSPAELESYLQKKEESIAQLSGGSSSTAEFTTEPTGLTETLYIVTIHTLYWGEHGFPDMAEVTFKRLSDATICTDFTSYLTVNGGNFGEWHYNHSNGTGSISGRNGSFFTHGIYTEVYGVGQATYNKNWSVNINGNFSANGVTATVSFSLLN